MGRRLLSLVLSVLVLSVVLPAKPGSKKSISSDTIVKAFMDSIDSPSFVCLDTLLAAVDSGMNADSLLLDAFIATYNENYRDNPGTKVRGRLADSLSLKMQNRREEIANAELNSRGKIWDSITGFLKEHKVIIKRYWPFAAGVVIIIAIVAVLIYLRRKKEESIPTFQDDPEPENEPAVEPEIVVRRRTTTILKKQSLEDVLHNDSYYCIEASDFCQDSAVRRLYIKNTCIKDIYNMYADDLRNPDNPKEDGCMVLGRWVFDSDTGEYYVSLEYVVKPGDDAVFQEYELNFGGKIKLRVAESLRRLRRDTELQYDLTCWVHSHPGLGVFFSNSDNGVHIQLKHSTHPKFLTAIVVDILTPEMEFGIFTFKRSNDLVVNSKQDITRMYSLETLYQWALSSEYSSYKPEDYFDILSGVESRDESCDAIRLSNGAIIDICQILASQPVGLSSFVHGFVHTHGIHSECIIEKVASERAVPNYEMLGCFVTGTHLSLPSIQNAISDYISTIKFVLFYSTTHQTLVSVPVLQGQLVMDEKYYSEETIENLKIWTRRRR